MDFTTSENYRNNPVLYETFEFAIQVVKYSELLELQKKIHSFTSNHPSGNLYWANVKEAQNSESRGDFINKLKIALKEADETEYWLFLSISLNYKNPGIPI